MSDSDRDSSPDPDFPTSRHVLEPECDRCPALVDSRERISWGTGPVEDDSNSSEPRPRETDVFVVGEAPGYGNPDADRWQGGNWTGKAYTSRHSGRRIRRMLESVGYDDAYYTNAVKCFPASGGPRSSSDDSQSTSAESRSSSDDEPSNREPTAAERSNCRTHLLAELEAVSPTVVLATGKHATVTVLEADGRTLEGGGFLETVLEPSRCRELDVWLLPVVHPSYQDVWIGRLGFEPDEYLAAIGETLDALCTHSSVRRATNVSEDE